ncbi:MAG: MFS transporter [Candidatus Sumerlaeota bacterium]|nr:MFS transporter [Candidatus Sumerlaeota bacterium]
MSFVETTDPREERRRIWAWQWYDWANSAFATVILGACLPVYFSKVSLATLPEDRAYVATGLWAATSAISMALVAAAAILLGPISDATARKKACLGGLAALGVLATALFAFCPPSWWWMIALLFILASLGYNGANVFYDALLPSVARREKLDQVSSGGYALGYLGGGLMLALAIGAMYKLPQQSPVPGQASFPIVGMRISFFAVAVWWVVFAIPLFRRVPEPPCAERAGAFAPRVAFERLGQTFRELRRYRELLKFLVAFWLYSDGFGTIIKMAAIYAAEIFRAKAGSPPLRILGYEVPMNPWLHILAVYLMVQFVGVPCTLLWSASAKRVGAKRSVLACLAIYSGICVFAFFMREIWHFYALGLAVALVQGGSQALSRSMYATLVPKGKEAEFFGFYNISGKFAGILGPAIMAIVGSLAGSSRPAILSLIVFFVVGAAVLAGVRFEGPADLDRNGRDGQDGRDGRDGRNGLV